MADVPRAGKRHNLIRQPPRCTSFSGGVCSVQDESEMRGGCSFVFRRRHQSKKQLYLRPAADLTLRHDRSLQEGEEEAMRRQLAVFVTLALVMSSLTGVAGAKSETLDYRWLAGEGDTALGALCALGGPPCPNLATASNGDTIEIAGEGTLSVHPKSVTGSGSFKHIFAAGGFVSGTWEATQLLSFKSYGPNVNAGLPPEFEAGRATISVQLFVGGNQVGSGILQVGCLLGGPKEPGGLFEGVKLSLQGGPNFNKVDPTSTLFILQP